MEDHPDLDRSFKHGFSGSKSVQVLIFLYTEARTGEEWPLLKDARMQMRGSIRRRFDCSHGFSVCSSAICMVDNGRGMIKSVI